MALMKQEWFTLHLHPCILIQHFIVDLTEFSVASWSWDNIFSSSVSEEEEIDEDKNLKVG